MSMQRFHAVPFGLVGLAYGALLVSACPGVRSSRVAYDEKLAERVRRILKRRRGFGERKMFGGICFLIEGNMTCGVVDDLLMLRLGNEGAADALRHPHTREMDFTGKPLKSMVYVRREGSRSKAALEKWVKQAADFARSLPPQ